VGTVVLGLQGGIASGSETTFDGQAIEPGIHLRWGFQPELGFPPGGFWLCRRATNEGEKTVDPPSAYKTMVAQAQAEVAGPNATVTAVAGTNQFEAIAPTPCRTVTLFGCASKDCSEILIETFCKNSDGVMEETSRQVVRVRPGAFRISVSASDISTVRVTGADSLEECGCGTEPPTDCGCGNPVTTGGGTGPTGGQPVWGNPGKDGWQCWGVPFTLPVTNANWPARYFGAPDPQTTPDATMAVLDVKEAERRLGALQLNTSLSAAAQRLELRSLRAELKRLVEGFPSTLLPNVPLPTSSAGGNAPALNLSVMQELLLLALNPYFARVLGLYFVDVDVTPGVTYDYFLIGFWGSTPAQTQTLYPGQAPGAPLALGQAQFNGMTIQTQNTNTFLWRSLLNTNTGTLQTDPSAPTPVAPAISSAVAGLSPQPQAVLALYSPTTMGWFPTSAPAVSIALTQTVMSVDVQVAGQGNVTALSGGNVVATAGFNNSTLANVTVTATSASAPIDTIQVSGLTQTVSNGIVVSIGALTTHPIYPDAIGFRFALLGGPGPITLLPAPGAAAVTYMRRQADVDPNTLALVPHSMFNVEWPAPAATPAQVTGNPMTDPLALPPPTRPIGFVAEREDSGKSGSLTRLSKWIAAASSPTPANSKITTPRLFRYLDTGVVDPVGGYRYRVGGFDIFGVVGLWNLWTHPIGVEKIAAAPTNLRTLQFDNTTSGGGAPTPDGSAWSGGTLLCQVNWSGAAFAMYPDIETAQATVQSVDLASGAPTGVIATQNFTLPTRKAQAFTVNSITPGSSPNTVVVQVTPALTALLPTDPAALILFTLPDGTIERYVTRPAAITSGGTVVATLQAGPNARIVSQSSAFIGQPAYLVSGYSVQPSLQVPLNIPITVNTARGQISIQGSTQNPFDSTEQVVDPNGVNPNYSEPISPTLYFTGAQRLVPPPVPTPVHSVDHVYYGPADYTGMASATLPFETPGGSGIYGYILQRAPIRSIQLADVARRQGLTVNNAAAPNAADPNPVVPDGGYPQRQDLGAWINAINQWITIYNNANNTSWTTATVLTDGNAQRAFVEHFYGGLLDDELRALADIPANSIGYARVNTTAYQLTTPMSDSVNGTGYGRNVYQMAAVNGAGTIGDFTDTIGPYYSMVVTPPRPPVLYKLQPTENSILVAWALDTNPDVAAYLIYRAPSVAQLSDLRYFGSNPAYPVSPSALAQVIRNTQTLPAVAFGAGEVDPRIIALVPDPRLCARDYQGSDMAEIILPSGLTPDEDTDIYIYRQSDYKASLGPLHQVAFNYWTPPPPATSGIAQIITTNPPFTRLTGLRIGLGRGVPVVVVATFKGQVQVLGNVPVRRAGFTDGVLSNGSPVDPNTLTGAPAPSVSSTNAYAVVAVDIFGNISGPSTVFASQMLALATV
jgi:hypothetical protein